MENKENIINELYRNMQLMQIDSSHLNEQKFLSRLFRGNPKFVVGKALKKFIEDSSDIQNIITNPNGPKQINFKDAYSNWLSNPNDKGLQNELVLKYLDLDAVTVLSKTEILDKVLNIGYNKLSNILGKIMENPSNIDNIIISYKITDQKTIKILKEYYNIYKNFGSGKRQDLSVGAINKLKQLADDSDYWFETFNFYKQTIKSLIDGWKYGKQGLEVKMLDKYRAYLENLKGVTDSTQIEDITLAYKKSIDSTFRSYLMIQDDLATQYIDTLTKTLKQKSGNPNALEFSQIIRELKAGSLGEKYPGFKLTAQLASVNDKNKIKKTLWDSINPAGNNLRIISDLKSKKMPKFIMDGLNSNTGKTIRRTLVWGAFPNKQLLYTLIASNRTGLQKKQWRTLYSLYLQYSFLGALRSSIQTIFIPAAYTAYTLMDLNLRGYLEQSKLNFPLLPELTDEERKQIGSEKFLGDVANVFSKQFLTHYYSTWASVGQIGNGGWDSKIYQIAYGIGIPNEVKSFDNSMIANFITKIASSDIGGAPNKDYDSFYRMIFSLVTPNLDKTKKDIENNAKIEGERIQAGGGQIDVNSKTWNYTKTDRNNINLVDISFPYNNTKIVKINNQYSLGNTDFKNVNNIVRISTPKNFTIISMEITDNNDKKHIIKEK
jgi:hypothetical protein